MSMNKEEVIQLWNRRSIPEGYAIVPIEPTDKMINAAINLNFSEFDGVELIYKAMIEASKAGD